ncbi:hypothetical protein AGMMS49959_12230 [Planctomycetales bacterium]|nr:hypothetical protein AGMMS49959_12230 [Planctomycetales bacterium]
MTPDINLLYDRVAGRAAYIDFYLQGFRLLTENRYSWFKFVDVPYASASLAAYSFAFEDKHIRPYVGHIYPDNELICRHKIIAATECAIMWLPPMLKPDEAKKVTTLKKLSVAEKNAEWSMATKIIAAQFAATLAIGIIHDWQTQTKKITGMRQRIYAQLTAAGLTMNNIRVEHEKWLRYALCHKEGEPKRFPFFPVSQTWTALEHSCLA